MAETLRTFMNIFDGATVQKIIIPNIQRDYAQGREIDDIFAPKVTQLESRMAFVWTRVTT